ncbi:SRSO17 transposase [Singulisphaera sp. GP187]|uniref:IS701 family transposase n=1 Tax=Singulisphaera sp. GP187 TaxID=1882752 RepID=UPI00092794DD|nr:IS701 family transposase [Singulisphaera sp. GP187]SIO58674.1 SRSO17 transposase [Singulisphaera sp. GP187]
MDPRFHTRLREMLAQADVPPNLVEGFLSRLETFVVPYAASMASEEQRRHTVEYLTGLISKLEHKTGEGIAYLHDQERQALQKFIGLSPWDHSPLLRTLAKQVGNELGEPDGVIVFDPSGFVKKGTKSVGVMRQWCGRVGKKENCQVAIYMGYASAREHALVDTRLYLPEEWTKDRKRCNAAGVPRKIQFQTRHDLALEMLDQHGPLLPHTWVAGDDEMGRPSPFRLKLRSRNERYLLAVPCNTLIRDLEAPPSERGGRGPAPWTPFRRIDHWRETLAESAWTTIEVRDGEKGPLVVEVVKCRVRARTPTNGTGPEELMFITREKQSDGKFKHDYYLSNADPTTPLKELARVTKAAHRIEECFKRAKGEAGLGDYQVRTWTAWHRHQTLALLAAWFLNQETRRGKNPDRRAEFTAAPTTARRSDRGAPQGQPSRGTKPPQHALVATQRVGSVVSPLVA